MSSNTDVTKSADFLDSMDYVVHGAPDFQNGITGGGIEQFLKVADGGSNRSKCPVEYSAFFGVKDKNDTNINDDDDDDDDDNDLVHAEDIEDVEEIGDELYDIQSDSDDEFL